MSGGVLAAARLARQAEDLPGLNGEGDVIDRAHARLT